MNFTPFVSGVGSGSGVTGSTFSSAALHQNILSSAKLPQNISSAGSHIGQLVNLVPGPESMQFFKPMDAASASNHNAQQQQMFTLPIAMPGAKPGDPQQTIQIQVLNPNIQLQQGIQTPKYQMQIPIQTFQQGGLGATLLTVAYAQDGSEGMQILGNSSLPEGYQVVAAIQPQELQLLSAHLPTGEVQQAMAATQQTQQQPKETQTFMLPNGQQLIINQPPKEDNKIVINNNTNNNNNNGPLVTIGQQTFRIKQEMFTEEECPMPVSLHQFLKFNPSVSEVKRESVETLVMSPASMADTESSKTDGMSEKDLKMIIADDQEIGTDPLSLPKPKKKKKYKKKPPKPKKPKPGQVVIATALDGTLLFCCPECHMAYPDKEQLEQHLVGHKVERRYICGICGAGLKRKEHLERHKLGHNPDRPFTCTICMKGFKRKEHLNLHFVIHSGEKNEVCTECGKGFYRKDHLRKHIKSHALRRSRDELAASINANSGIDVSMAESTNSDTQQSLVTGLDPNIQEVPVNNITIHVPTSSTPLPIQISVPQHIVSMANNQPQMMTVYSSANGHTMVDEILSQHT